MSMLKISMGVCVWFGTAVLAATPPSGTVTEADPVVTWTGPFLTPTGSATCNGANDSTCDNFSLTVVSPSPEFGPFVVEIIVQPFGAGDWDLQVYDDNEEVVGDSGNNPGEAEAVVLINPAAGDYIVAAAPYAPGVGPDSDGDGSLESYTARAEIKSISGSMPPGSEYFTYANHVPPDSLGRGAAEPSIGANWESGRTMFQGGPETLRVDWDDCSSPPSAQWQDVAFVTTTGPSLDPILFTDPRTGRTLVSQLSANCSTAALTDDDGDNWLPSQGCGINSGVDHQSIGGGVFHEPLTRDPEGPLYPNAVYYCAQDLASALCARSDDGGITFGPAVPIYSLLDCAGLHGEPNVSPTDGTVYVPNKGCNGQQAVVVSEDNGLTWDVRHIPFAGPGQWDPDIGIGLDGTVYVGMTGANGHPQIAVSTDRGLTWSVPYDVGTEFGIDNTSFPAVVAGDGDRAAFGFLGISAGTGGSAGDDPDWPGGDPETRPYWHFYVAHTYDRGQTWTTIDVTGNDPVQRGTIFGGGFTPEGAQTRNLLDFNRATIDKFGRAQFGWADGCVGTCVTGTTNSNTEIGTISRQVGGLRLFAQYDVLDVPSAPNVSAKTSTGPPPANVINWAEPDDHGSRITQYDVYRRTESTSREVISTRAAEERSYIDSDIVGGEIYYYSVTATNGVGESLFCNEVIPGASEPPVHPCDYPGVTLLTDGEGDATTEQPEHDVLSLSVTEPFFLGTGKIMFVLNVAGLANPSPDTTWPIQFVSGGTDYAVRMHTDALGEVSFSVAAGADVTNPVLNPGTPADPASHYNVDGTIQIVVPRSAIGNPTPGVDLTQFLVRIRVELGAISLTPDNMPDGLGATGSYRIVGSENCDDTGECPDPIFDGLEVVSAPLEEACALDLSWSTAITSCGPPRYNVYRSTDSGFLPSLDNIIAVGIVDLDYRDDAGLVLGTTYYYVVRAEDAQSIFGGPANGGQEDNNFVRISGSPSGPPVTTSDFADDFEPDAEPGWTVDTAENANVGSANWDVVSDPFAHSASNSYFSDATGLDIKDDRLASPQQYLSSNSHLTFWHRFSFESGFDGGVLEVSIDGGANWDDVISGGGSFVAGAYNGSIDPGFGSPIAGRDAWTGDSDFVDAMSEVQIDLGAFAGPGRLLRWRLTQDPLAPGALPGVGWWIDDITVTNLLEAGPCTTQSCGDGIVDAGEQCDAGAFNSDIEPDACREDCTAAGCGDDVTDSGEGCDDGMANSDSQPDACRTDCQPARCGDEVIDSGELCDDGSSNSDDDADACRTNCLPARCGDGTIDSGESCDNGPMNSDSQPDACRTNCIGAHCGDGIVDTGEECDEGAFNSDSTPDACRTTCAAASCGDNTIDTGEFCDDGNGVDGDGCTSVCVVEPVTPGAGNDTCIGGANDGLACSTHDQCPDGTCGLKSRYITITSSNPPIEGDTRTSLKVTVVSLPLFPQNEGAVYWAGPEVVISNPPHASLVGSGLECEPLPGHSQVWTDGNLHLFGNVIVPEGLYEVRHCIPDGTICSDPINVGTGKWGDLIPPFGGPNQPNFADITAIVDKFKELPTAPNMTRTDLRSAAGEAVDGQADFADISADVDAFKDIPYPYNVLACP